MLSEGLWRPDCGLGGGLQTPPVTLVWAGGEVMDETWEEKLSRSFGQTCRYLHFTALPLMVAPCPSVDEKPPSSKTPWMDRWWCRAGLQLHLRGRRQAVGRAEGFCRYAALAAEPFSNQSGAQMANNYSSACAWLLASHRLFRDWCNPLLFMIVWDCFRWGLNTIC